MQVDLVGAMVFGVAKRLGRKFADGAVASRIIEVLDRRAENRLREFGMLAHAFEFKKINGVAGDYFEFGLWRGKTFCYAHQLKRRYKLDRMELWGFNSFAGLPVIDDVKNNVWHEGQFACSEDEFRQIVRRRGMRPADYNLVKGFYQDSLNDNLHIRLAGRCAAIVYIDCDLFASTALVLSFVERYLIQGSVICFDEYWGYRGDPNQGEQRAFREFAAGSRELGFIPWIDYAPLGKSFIAQR